MSTVSQFIIQRLNELKITTAFGVSGQYNGEMFKSFKGDSSLKLCYVTTAEEATIAAIGYYKMSMLPGVVFLSHGTSDLTNALGGTFNSCLEKTPMIIIGATPPLKRLNYNEMCTVKITKTMFKDVTVNSVCLPYSKNAGEIIDDAFRKCLTTKKPVFLEIAEDLFSWSIEKSSKKIKFEPILSKKEELKNSIDRISKIIKKSKKTLLLLGEELCSKYHGKYLKEFLEKFKIYWSTTLGGKSIVSEEVKNYVGVYMGNSSNSRTIKAFKEAQVILCIGVTLKEIQVYNSYLDILSYKEFIFVENNMVKFNTEIFAPVTVGDFLETLTKNVELIESEFELSNEPEFKYQSSDDLTYDTSIQSIVKSGILNGKVVLGDSSMSMISLVNIPRKEENTFIAESIWHTKGFPIYASLGVYYSNKKRPVLFLGDGGLQRAYYSISTHVREKTGAIIFVFFNEIHAIEQWNQFPMKFGKDGDIDMWNILPKVNHENIGKGSGAKVSMVKNQGELEKVLKNLGSDSEEVNLIVMKIPKKDLPKYSKWKVEKKNYF